MSCKKNHANNEIEYKLNKMLFFTIFVASHWRRMRRSWIPSRTKYLDSLSYLSSQYEDRHLHLKKQFSIHSQRRRRQYSKEEDINIILIFIPHPVSRCTSFDSSSLQWTILLPVTNANYEYLNVNLEEDAVLIFKGKQSQCRLLMKQTWTGGRGGERKRKRRQIKSIININRQWSKRRSGSEFLMKQVMHKEDTDWKKATDTNMRQVYHFFMKKMEEVTRMMINTWYERRREGWKVGLLRISSLFDSSSSFSFLFLFHLHLSFLESVSPVFGFREQNPKPSYFFSSQLILYVHPTMKASSLKRDWIKCLFYWFKIGSSLHLHQVIE